MDVFINPLIPAVPFELDAFRTGIPVSLSGSPTPRDPQASQETGHLFRT